VARAFTKRDDILKFEGCYHGHADYLLAKAGSGVATLGLPGLAGRARGLREAHADRCRTTTSRRCSELFAARGHDIAAVVLEPVDRQHPASCRPLPGFLEGLIDITQAHGALVVFDEVMTGFRVSHDRRRRRRSTASRRTSRAFGKVIGGGMPMAAYGGKRRHHGPHRAGRPRLSSGHAERQPGAPSPRASRRSSTSRQRQAPTSKLDATCQEASAGPRSPRSPPPVRRRPRAARGLDVHAVLQRRLAP
jgi:glutamate-1-semialdehyde aminotransferase